MEKQPEISSTQQPQFLPMPITQGLPQMLSYLLENPSIPLAMRRQFYVLWENVIFGNYTEKDIAYLMSKFREWCILVLWYIPEQRWGNILQYQDGEDTTSQIRVDLNLLLNMLEQLYYINLTRGRDGFTIKELGTTRSFIQPLPPPERKKGIRLF